MKLIDAYLWRYGKKRYDVFKQTGLSQQTLASANGKSADALTVRIVQALAQTVGKTAGEALEEMISMEREEQLVAVATTKEQLWELLRAGEGRIRVQGELCFDVYELARKMYRPQFHGVTSGQMVFNAFTQPLLERAINQILDVFRQSGDEERRDLKIADRLRNYNLQFTEGEILLESIQFDQ